MKPRPLSLGLSKTIESINKRLEKNKRYSPVFKVYDEFLEKARESKRKGYTALPEPKEMFVTEILNLYSDGIALLFKDVGSACKFYLRYRNRPKLLIKERKKYSKELMKLFSSKKNYKDWLFEKVFKGVLK